MSIDLPGPLREALAPAFEASIDLPALFSLVQEKLPRALGFQTGQLWVLDPRRRRLLGPRDVGLDPSDGFSDERAREGMSLDLPLWIPDRKAGSPLAALFPPEVKAWLVAAIRLEGEALGVLALRSQAPVEVVAVDVAALLAAPIRRALTQSAVLQDLQLHQLLMDLVRRMSGDFKLPDVLQHLFRSLERMLPVDAHFVAVKGVDGRFEALIETDLDEQNRRMFFPTPRPMDLSRSAAMDRVDPNDYLLILRTAEELKRLQEEEPNAQGIGNLRRRSASLLYVPIWVGDALRGILSVQSYQHDAYRHSDARRLIQVADYLGLAIRLSASSQ